MKNKKKKEECAWEPLQDWSSFLKKKIFDIY